MGLGRHGLTGVLTLPTRPGTAPSSSLLATTTTYYLYLADEAGDGAGQLGLGHEGHDADHREPTVVDLREESLCCRAVSGEWWVVGGQW